jgi:hypothetical protein
LPSSVAFLPLSLSSIRRRAMCYCHRCQVRNAWWAVRVGRSCVCEHVIVYCVPVPCTHTHDTHCMLANDLCMNITACGVCIAGKQPKTTACVVETKPKQQHVLLKRKQINETKTTGTETEDGEARVQARTEGAGANLPRAAGGHSAVLCCDVPQVGTVQCRAATCRRWAQCSAVP